MPTTDKRDSCLQLCRSLLIIGASARQYAESAVRAGIECTTVDLFADWDLQQFADSYVVESLDDFDATRFFKSCDELPDRFVICGGMEKRPQLISEISQHLPYAGVAPKQIERLNNPFDIADFCAANQIMFPRVCLSGILDDEAEAFWLSKPYQSAGGVNIYHQEFVAGQSYSSLFFSNISTTNLIGSTIQLVGLAPFSNRPFHYCGSIGPVEFRGGHQRELERIGNLLAREFQLTGVFGIDWILDASETIWLIEINPRMTASAEIFELAGCVPSITALHLESAAGGEGLVPAGQLTCYGKAILFSSRTESFTVSQAEFDYFCGRELLNGRRSIADIPKIGTRIGPGEPILTLFVSGNCESELLAQLQSKALNIRRAMAKIKSGDFELT